MIPAAVHGLRAPILAAFAKPAAVTKEADVAEAVWRAATDGSERLRYPAGADAVALAARRAEQAFIRRRPELSAI